ncbi:hypothetical protein [uncultured Chitinophaga sp.]|uniref:hypothetical protein n=1 Tax=uncultured Chitinophaga sp. TaxID=339340 RepID=UPI0025ED1B1F|nr:hypothetical protein [uncultured Chitinophaga sp.]
MRIVSKMLIASLCVLLSVCHEAGAKSRTIFELLPQISRGTGYTVQYTYPSGTLTASATVPTYGGTLTVNYTVFSTLEHNFYNGNYAYTKVYTIGVGINSYTYSGSTYAVSHTGSSSGSTNTATYTGTGTVRNSANTATLFNFSAQMVGTVNGPYYPGQPTFSGTFTITGVTP